jgi:hypothetical protein
MDKGKSIVSLYHAEMSIPDICAKLNVPLEPSVTNFEVLLGGYWVGSMDTRSAQVQKKTA